MSYLYAALAAATTTTTEPSTWPPDWTWPGPPWPPGWPIAIGGTYSILIGLFGTIPAGSSSIVESRIVDSDTLDTADLSTYQLRIRGFITTATGSEAVRIKENFSDDWTAFTTDDDGNVESRILKNVTNYTGSRYGDKDNYYFDTGSYVGKTLTVNLDIYGVSDDFSGSRTATVIADTEDYILLETGDSLLLEDFGRLEIE